MTIPNQKKERVWNDPPIPGELSPKVESPVPKTGFVEFLKQILFVEKTPVWFIVATLMFYLNSIILYEVIPALIKYRDPSYQINSLLYNTYGGAITLLFIYFWIAYFVDYRIPRVLKTNEMYEKQPHSYKLGYFLGCVAIGFISLAIIFFVLNGGKF